MVGGSGGEVGRVFGEGISTKAIMSNLVFCFTIIRGTLGPRAISNLETHWVVCNRFKVKWEGHLLFFLDE